MKRTHLQSIVSGVFLLGLTGCGRIVDWGKKAFYQGEKVQTHDHVPRSYVRSVSIYNEMTTVALFEAIWLSHDVKTAFAQASMAKQGKTEERHRSFLRRQLEENRHFVSFYVLSTYKIVLGDPLSRWSLFLEVDGHYYTPLEIKVVDLDPIYQEFFGKKFNQFKVAYRVKFDAQNAEDSDLIKESTSAITLHFRSTQKEATMSWPVRFADKHDYEEHESDSTKQVLAAEEK